jgi:hypothetical protein
MAACADRSHFLPAIAEIGPTSKRMHSAWLKRSFKLNRAYGELQSAACGHCRELRLGPLPPGHYDEWDTRSMAAPASSGRRVP